MGQLFSQCLPSDTAITLEGDRSSNLTKDFVSVSGSHREVDHFNAPKNSTSEQPAAQNNQPQGVQHTSDTSPTRSVTPSSASRHQMANHLTKTDEDLDDWVNFDSAPLSQSPTKSKFAVPPETKVLAPSLAPASFPKGSVSPEKSNQDPLPEKSAFSDPVVKPTSFQEKFTEQSLSTGNATSTEKKAFTTTKKGISEKESESSLSQSVVKQLAAPVQPITNTKEKELEQNAKIAQVQEELDELDEFDNWDKKPAEEQEEEDFFADLQPKINIQPKVNANQKPQATQPEKAKALEKKNTSFIVDVEENEGNWGDMDLDI